MQQRARELKAQAAQQDGEAAVLAAIAALHGSDRVLAERVHAIVMATAPNLAPRTWYGSPAYAKDDQVVCFFQYVGKFKTRYATLGFSDESNFDDGRMWPVTYALTEITPTEEGKIAALVRKAGFGPGDRPGSSRPHALPLGEDAGSPRSADQGSS